MNYFQDFFLPTNKTTLSSVSVHYFELLCYIINTLFYTIQFIHLYNIIYLYLFTPCYKLFARYFSFLAESISTNADKCTSATIKNARLLF